MAVFELSVVENPGNQRTRIKFKWRSVEKSIQTLFLNEDLSGLDSPPSGKPKEDSIFVRATNLLPGNIRSKSSSDYEEHKKVGSTEIVEVSKRSLSSSSFVSSSSPVRSGDSKSLKLSTMIVLPILETVSDTSTASSDVFNSSALSFDINATVSSRFLIKAWLSV